MTIESEDIIFLGNSITFWGDWDELTDNERIKNWGIPGDHTFGLLGRIDDVIAARPSKLFILIGINDLSRGLSDSTLIANYRELVQRVRQGSTNTQLYLQSILPTNPVFEKLKGHYGYEKRIIDLNAQLMELAARTPNCTYIHLYPHFQDEQGYLKEEYTWDGVHLTVAGYRRWADLLYEQGFLVLDNQESKRSVGMKGLALSDLNQLLYSQERWIKVHVAEFLLWENYYLTDVRDVYLNESERSSNVPQYRIGIWRVLAQASECIDERKKWVDRIVEAFYDEQGPDRLHAIETLSKLKHSVVADVNEIYRELDLGVNSFLLYSLWNSAYLPGADVELIRSDFVDLLERTSRSTDPVLIAVTAFILRNLPPPTPSEWDRISVTALSYNDNSGVRASLLSTAWLLAPHTGESVTREKIRRELLAMENEEGAMMHILTALGASDQAQDRKILAELYHRVRDVNSPSYDADLHATAAYAILRSKRDNGHRFE